MQDTDEKLMPTAVREDSSVVSTASTIPNNEKRYSILSFLLSVILILGLAIGFRVFVAAPYLVEGASMEDTFQTFDYLIVDRLSYRVDEPQRGDVVVFHFPLDPSRTFIKRIIGLPGETVSIEGEAVTITNAENPEGFTLDEPYVADAHRASSSVTVTVGDGEYFVMGDNRKESADSRYWGPLPENQIVGRAFFRLYPLQSISILPGESRYGITDSQKSEL